MVLLGQGAAWIVKQQLTAQQGVKVAFLLLSCTLSGCRIPLCMGARCSPVGPDPILLLLKGVPLQPEVLLSPQGWWAPGPASQH